MAEAWRIAGAAITAIGGGGAIVLLLSSWLGKVWAGRLMEKQRADHAQALEALRNDLRRETDRELEQFKRELDRQLAEQWREKHEKLQIYRASINLVTEVLGGLDAMMLRGENIAHHFDRWVQLNTQRLQAYAFMAMHAPQEVMDANDRLWDFLILIWRGEEPYDWDRVRSLGLALLNEIRKDIGLDKAPIEYRGSL